VIDPRPRIAAADLTCAVDAAQNGRMTANAHASFTFAGEGDAGMMPGSVAMCRMCR
jgi:hypothetical protein